MPNMWTFTIPSVSLVIKKYVSDRGIGWVDPFAGENSPAEITNDLNPQRNTTAHMDALQFLKQIKTNSAIGVLYDPPYSFTQAKECYDSFGKDLFLDHDFSPTKMDYWAACKNEIARILKVDGICICFGWNSNGIGKNRGFEMLEVLIIAHGGSKNDTLVTVEKKFSYSLEL